MAESEIANSDTTPALHPDVTRLPERHLPLPQTVSEAARAYLGTYIPATEQPQPLWAFREQADAMLHATNEAMLAAFDVTVEESELGGVPVHFVRPAHVSREDAILVNLHGGGFVLGSGSLGEAIPVAHETGLAVVAIDYRLAPEHPYPAAIEDILAVYRALIEDYASDRIGVYGASSGGFLTGQLVARLHHDGLPLPAACGVLTGGGDLGDLGESARIYTLSGLSGHLLFPPDHELNEVRAWLDGASADDPLVSPLKGDLSFFPPTLLIAGTRDNLLSATTLFHRGLRKAGVEAELYVFEAMPHAFWYAFHLPESQEMVTILSGFLTERLAG